MTPGFCATAYLQHAKAKQAVSKMMGQSRAQRWMGASNPQLDGRTPTEMILAGWGDWLLSWIETQYGALKKDAPPKVKKARSKSGNLLTFNRFPIEPRDGPSTSVPSYRFNLLPR